MKNLLFISYLFILISCGGDENENSSIPDYAIKEEKLIEILSEIHITDAASKQNHLPSNVENWVKYSQYKFILDKHKITKSKFDSTITFYTDHPKLYLQLYDKILEHLGMEKAKYPTP